VCAGGVGSGGGKLVTPGNDCGVEKGFSDRGDDGTVAHNLEIANVCITFGKTSLHITAGASGGPVFKKSCAYGTLVGFDKSLTKCDFSFEGINTATSALNVHVMLNAGPG
jgi:hypothetical protein